MDNAEGGGMFQAEGTARAMPLYNSVWELGALEKGKDAIRTSKKYLCSWKNHCIDADCIFFPPDILANLIFMERNRNRKKFKKAF